MKVLIVDDDPTTRLVLERVLSHFGDISTCASGENAVLEYRRALQTGENYDLVCMDLVMPGMGGLEAVQRIRQDEESYSRSRASKIVVITGLEDMNTIENAFTCLCDAYIVKPVEAKVLLELLECLFDAIPSGVSVEGVC